MSRTLLSLLILSFFYSKTKAQSDSVRIKVGRWAHYIRIKTTKKLNAPLIIGLHGYGMDENQMATLVNPDFDFDCHYLSLRGFIPMGRSEYSWFSISGTPPQLEYDKQEIEEVMDLLSDFIDKLSKRYMTDEIYLIGYSQGATLLYSYASRAHSAVKAMAAFSGTALYRPAGEKRALSFFIGHGKLDPLISESDIKESQQYLQQMGIQVDFNEYTVPHVVSKQGRRDLAAWLKALQKK